MLQAEKLCLHSALDALIASSISQSADSVVMLKQTVLLSCVHQTIRDNIVVCELENIRLAAALVTGGSVPLHITDLLPVDARALHNLSSEDLRMFFSQLEI